MRGEQLQGKIVTIFAADNPRDVCEELEGGFPSVFPHHVVDLGQPHLFTVIPTACGEHLNRGITSDRNRRGGNNKSRSQGVNRGSTGTGTGTMCIICARLHTL